ncbi:MAG: class I SAM-dependent methyltransferase [Pseudomonadota bacterium]
MRRTIKGEPLPQSQIDMILRAISTGLALRKTDTLLELACGNAALAQSYITSCQAYLGIDISPTLIAVAKTSFEAPPEIVFRCADVLDVLGAEPSPERFTKVLCYAAIQYFPDEMIVEILTGLHREFPNVARIFLGNLPDLERAGAFFGDALPPVDDLRSNETPIGIWRSQTEMGLLCDHSGWDAQFSRMPDPFYAASYRYDITLTRKRT